MHIARSRVQFPKEQRAQNVNEFIDQKKEMFLVELSCNTIKEEIEHLEQKKTLKDKALSVSTDQLQKDDDKLTSFIQQDEVTTDNRTKDADAAAQKTKDATMQSKKLDTEIQH